MAFALFSTLFLESIIQDVVCRSAKVAAAIRAEKRVNGSCNRMIRRALPPLRGSACSAGSDAHTRLGHAREERARRESHVHAVWCVFFYLLGGERLRPVVQHQPVFVEGLGLRRCVLALLSVCDFPVLIHG